jgi:hypothetical protein
MAILVGGVAEAAPRGKAAPKRSSSYDSYETRASSGMSGGQRMAGCGLGSMVIEDNNKWSQVGAAFLNGTGMQTFGISFGTSNCTEDGVATASREKDAFVEANFADLRRDMAVGKGEYLSSLANLYGCQGERAEAFGLGLQRNQGRFDNVAPEAASGLLDTVVAQESLGCAS